MLQSYLAFKFSLLKVKSVSTHFDGCGPPQCATPSFRVESVAHVLALNQFHELSCVYHGPRTPYFSQGVCMFQTQLTVEFEDKWIKNVTYMQWDFVQP